ncbi:TatD family deoxyribonuclease [Mycoplasma flocculare]|uniref:TatD family deoxyribonuclease n=1 Tax=Mesomycoplasma flocculare TaxID=2128 RepID=A0AAW9XBL4_MESFC|nr:TatD family hydrolase [Mesomycoplasma flocculare]MXR12215.1 TatD family deoxyribonuclease [Mesomycoplasma flocculare]MXR13747.1 TatD family deoxyribonuclease [Mesomycoplasma flocculare]MXR39182.1 TatD family deoxyribonuclease [Mycoplasma sp. MF12]MXR56629.1 TatD family deoxyribonuclease [Mesomycoplasma flocculare]
MYLKIQQFSPRYLALVQASIKKFNLKLNLVTQNGKIIIGNFDYYQNFEKNYEFLIVDEHKGNDFIFAFFVISQKEQTFCINLYFFSEFLEENWINIVGEFVLDFIKENYNLETFYVKILNQNIKLIKFYENFATTFDKNLSIFKIDSLKKYKFIDAHCHPFHKYYENPQKQVKNWLADNIELIFVVGTSWNDLAEIEQISKYSGKTYKIIGIHPTLVKKSDDFFLLQHHIDDKVVGIGEVGLDFYYENNPSVEIQLKSLLAQIELAKNNKIPVMLHIRDKPGENKAMLLILEIVTRFSEINFIFHNFSTDYGMFKKLVEKNNCFFSYSGVITFKKSVELRKIVKETPVSKILCETDAPYLTPEPNRKIWPNASTQIQWTYQTIANLKNLTKRELSEIIYENLVKIFKV